MMHPHTSDVFICCLISCRGPARICISLSYIFKSLDDKLGLHWYYCYAVFPMQLPDVLQWPTLCQWDLFLYYGITKICNCVAATAAEMAAVSLSGVFASSFSSAVSGKRVPHATVSLPWLTRNRLWWINASKQKFTFERQTKAHEHRHTHIPPKGEPLSVHQPRSALHSVHSSRSCRSQWRRIYHTTWGTREERWREGGSMWESL